MRHLVVIDSHSVMGATLLEGTHDGIALGGHPTVDCTKIDDTGPYLACTRDLTNEGSSRRSQQLLIPHTAIAYVWSYAREEERPMGFALRGTAGG